MDEINNMEFYVFPSMMISGVEVFANICFRIWALNVSPMSLKPLHQCVLGLTYILLLACLAGDAVYQIARSAANSLVADVFTACGSTGDFPGFIEVGAIPATAFALATDIYIYIYIYIYR